tara:strand:- start:835 stop:2937 length:2103 start_codon:yes stop_codon:yes gene_type:complete
MVIDGSGNVGIGTTSPNQNGGTGAFTWASPLQTIAGSRPTLFLNGSSVITTLRMWPRATDGTSTSVDDWHINALNEGSGGYLSFAPQGGAIAPKGLHIKNTGNVGIGTTAPGTVLHVSTTGANAYSSTITKGTNHSGLTLVQKNNTNDMTGVYFATGTGDDGTHWSGITGSRSNYASGWETQLNFYAHPFATTSIADANQVMVIKGSGKVGIGTTTPATKFHASTTGEVYVATIENLGVAGNKHGLWIKSDSTWSSSNLLRLTAGTGDTDTFIVNPDRVYIVPNVGIGTTSPNAKLEIKGASSTNYLQFNNSSDSELFKIDSNFNWAWGTTSPAQAFDMRDTSGNAFFALDRSNGNVGIGTTSPPQPLAIGTSAGSNLNYYSGTTNVISSSSGIKVSKAIANDAGAGSGLNLSNTSSTDGTMSPMLHFSALSASTTYSTTYAGIWGRKRSSGTDTNWNAGSIEFGTAHSAGIHKRMEINYLGSLITTPQAGASVIFNENGVDADFRVESVGQSHMFFVDASQNRATFGQSTASISSGGLYMDLSNDTQAHIGVCVSENASNVGGLYINRQNHDGPMIIFRRNNTQRGSIDVTTVGTTYNTTSDLRLKKDIQTITDGTDKLMAMNPVTHGWKADPEADTVHGFIAQEMMNIVPEAVSGDPEGEDMMSMDYGRITPVIVAALQDALKEIKELKTRINELEGK